MKKDVERININGRINVKFNPNKYNSRNLRKRNLKYYS